MKLSEAFPKNSFAVSQIEKRLGFTTIEEVRNFLSLEDHAEKKLLGIRGIGRMFIQKIMRFEFAKPIVVKPMDSLTRVNLDWIVKNFQTESAEHLRETFEFTLRMRDGNLPKP